MGDKSASLVWNREFLSYCNFPLKQPPGLNGRSFAWENTFPRTPAQADALPTAGPSQKPLPTGAVGVCRLVYSISSHKIDTVLTFL